MGSEYPILSLTERDRRWKALRKLLAAQDMDCLLVFGLKGREHFEGYIANEYIEGMAILPRETDPVLLTWHPKMVIRRQGSRVDAKRFWIKDVRAGKFGPLIVEVIKERGLHNGHIGVLGLHAGEAGCPEGIVPYPLWQTVLDGLPNARLTDITWEVREVMLAKSEEELNVLRYAAGLGEQACQAMLEAVKPGATEFEIYDAVESAIHFGGGVPRDPYLIMTWGSDDVGWGEPAWTYFGGTPRRVEPGDLIMAELFPSYGGLETQQQMCIAVAPVDPIIEELGRIARKSYEAGLAALRPGATFAQLSETMLQSVRDIDGGWTLTPMIHSISPLGWVGGMGYNLDRMPPGLKHYAPMFPLALGEQPLVLREGMSFAFEPNVCKGQRRANVGGTVVVGQDRPEELNRLPCRMHLVG
jgi:Xaa-Pro aminopeptidase